MGASASELTPSYPPAGFGDESSVVHAPKPLDCPLGWRPTRLGGLEFIQWWCEACRAHHDTPVRWCERCYGWHLAAGGQ